SHLTYYFPKRGDLLLGIAEHSITKVMATLAERLAQRAPQTALADTLAEAMVSGVPPRLMVGLVVAADADPAIRERLRDLVRGIRDNIAMLLSKAGLTSIPEAPLLFHASVVGLALLYQARLNQEAAREVQQGIAAMLRLLAARA
ncbi:MAG: hypothetical protein LC110_10250, partial [Burkholderiales bacterium]|nr:hypothetical protein [Burkholderiales bacterium]